MIFEEKYFVIFYYLTKCNYLAAFTSWDIEQYVYCNCLLTILWRHNFEINLTFLIKPFSPHDQKVKSKYLYNEESFSDEIKSTFYHF